MCQTLVVVVVVVIVQKSRSYNLSNSTCSSSKRICLFFEVVVERNLLWNCQSVVVVVVQVKRRFSYWLHIVVEVKDSFKICQSIAEVVQFECVCCY